MYSAGVPDKNETPDDELEAALTKYTETASKSIRAQADTGKRIIETVREYLAASPIESESTSLAQKAACEDQRTLPAIGKLAKNSSTMGEMQALSLLAVVIRWFSIESGRPEEQILERLAAPFVEGENESLSLVQRAAQDLRNARRGTGD